MFRLFASLALLALATAPVRADIVPQFEGIPATYSPGVPFSFNVLAPDLFDFTGFNVLLRFEASVIDPDLTATAAPGVGRYPFPTTGGFTVNGTPPGPGETIYTLTFGDSGPLTFTAAGVRDLLAVVTVTPGATLTGDITITSGNETVLIYNTEGRDDGPPSPAVVGEGAAVPAPAGVVLVGIAGVVLGVRNRLKRRAPVAA
jgi:hypothetical protein